MTLATESRGKDDWGKHYDVRGQAIGLIGTKMEMKKGLSTKEKVELFKRLGELIRSQCECYGREGKNCDRCFDLLQLLRIHKVLIAIAFGTWGRREEDRLKGLKE